LVGASSLEALMDATVPEHLRYRGLMSGLPAPMTEREAIDALAERAGQNRVLRSYLGHGFHDTITPPVILRNILENPGWYTAYTPYQAEISQGRLEAVLVYQTMVQQASHLP
jgi:glycine dehydrogenase